MIWLTLESEVAIEDDLRSKFPIQRVNWAMHNLATFPKAISKYFPPKNNRLHTHIVLPSEQRRWIGALKVLISNLQHFKNAHSALSTHLSANIRLRLSLIRADGLEYIRIRRCGRVKHLFRMRCTRNGWQGKRLLIQRRRCQ